MRSLLFCVCAFSLTLSLTADAAQHDSSQTQRLRFRVVQLLESPSGFPRDGAAAAFDINNSGSIVGEAVAVDFSRAAFLWRRSGSVVDIGTITDPLRSDIHPSSAMAINERGQIVGFGFVHRRTHGFVWTHGRSLDIGALPGGTDTSVATNINDRGQVVGYSDSDAGREAVLWQDGSLMSLGDLPHDPGTNDDSLARAINNRGMIVGDSSGSRAFVWYEGVMQALPLPPGTEGGSIAMDINERGEIVGTAVDVPVLWSRGRAHELGMPEGHRDGGIAFGVNDRGDVVGETRSRVPFGNGVATIWLKGGEPRDLNNMIAEDDPLKGCVVLTAAFAINDRREIAAWGPNVCAQTFANSYRLTPVR
jgi:probable HAF family extracellular repeat protein